MLADKGAYVHPMSGAGRIKDDGHDDQNLYEVKTAAATHQISAVALSDLWTRAVQQGRDAIYMIEFGNGFTLTGIVEKG